MSIQIKGGTSSDIVDVDAGKNLRVALSDDPSFVGSVKILDSEGAPLLTTENGALTVSLDGIVLFEQVDGTVLNTNVWSTSVDTMAIAQTGGFITLNSGLITTIAKYAILSSIKNIPMYGHLPLRVVFNAKVPVQPQSNLTMELGIGLVATNASPTDGAFFRWNSSTQFKCIVSNGGSEVASVALTAPVNNDVTLFQIVIVEDLVQFYIDDAIVAEIDVPTGQAYPTNSGRLPVFARVYNSGSAPSAAGQILIGQVIVVQQAMNQNKPWADTLSALGRGAYQSPITPFAQNANHANSTSPASATLSNTTASYVTLGGRWQLAAVAGSATDYALFAFQVPAGFQLYVNAVSINSIITGAAVAITATILDWSIGINSSAVSLATVDGVGTVAPRRISLGTQGFQVLAGIGQNATDIARIFPTPLVADGGRYVHIILQIPVGTATVSQVIRGDVQINGYFE